ncbi:hypothetical protein TNIN_101501 [Trichonephila inaurata madagascariensis]|uniref:Uncharacterized protein n=1 Tax=Trichonephila inaurata madagascariensis TaxID=2747483 RepID=A0A8X6YNT2_9ARAC|nr:hypothetical protein TNIN_101501 [Trichonephila inaurata madagascariensis]
MAAGMLVRVNPEVLSCQGCRLVERIEVHIFEDNLRRPSSEQSLSVSWSRVHCSVYSDIFFGGSRKDISLRQRLLPQQMESFRFGSGARQSGRPQLRNRGRTFRSQDF